jgi:hypothetical protein
MKNLKKLQILFSHYGVIEIARYGQTFGIPDRGLIPSVLEPLVAALPEKIKDNVVWGATEVDEQSQEFKNHFDGHRFKHVVRAHAGREIVRRIRTGEWVAGSRGSRIHG